MKNNKFIRALTALTLTAYAGAPLNLQAEVPKFEAAVLLPPGNATDKIGAAALNNRGEAVGNWYVSSTGRSGGLLVYPNGTIVNLPNLAGTGSNFNAVEIADLNDKTQIVGTYNSMAMVYTLPDGPINLSGPEVKGSSAYGINDAGQIVGTSAPIASLDEQAVIFLGNGTIIPISDYTSPGYFSMAYDINDRYGADGFGQIVGYTDGDLDWAFLYENGTMSNIGQVICSEQDSYALKINNRGEIAGYCLNTYADLYTGFIYGADTGDYAIFPDCYLAAINDSGWAVGNKNEDGFLIIDGIMHDLIGLILPSFGVTDAYPIDINDRGQILANTNLGTVLLTPIR